MNRARFRFHEELNDFLPRRKRHTTIVHPFDWRASIKDMIESLGVPHSEIEAILVHDQPVGFDHIVADGDDVIVFPRFEDALHTDGSALPVESRLRPPIPPKPRFVLDIHLGRLAAYLRMLGFDSVWRNDIHDEELAQVAHDERRVLLTRDVGCLKRSPVIYGYFVRSTNPKKRIAEVMDRFNLAEQVELFKHCMKCNGLVKRVDKTAVMDRLTHETADHFDEFHLCLSCERIYWKGSHYQRMQKLIAELLPAM
ncbi:MAG: Mut7-C ubiquitin/RNAse domain-containing protein [Chloroflexi bacterium]|nr:Mut7-C ubiquitin/RNAse domain-containing protein [Chloroflexota bacterium]